MNQKALVVVGRVNPEKAGRFPFSAVATGFCVHEDGVVATCWHVVDSIFRKYSAIDMPRRGEAKTIGHIPERHEVPAFSFMSGLGAVGEAKVFPLRSTTGHVDRDIATVELGGLPRPPAFPTVTFARTKPAVGETLNVLGHHQPGAPPVDADGQVGGFALTRRAAEVVAVDSESFWITYSVPKGMSGSPVFFPKTSEVAGMAVETWPRALARARLGIDQAVTRVVHIEHVVGYLPDLRRKADERARAGGRPWCDSHPPIGAPARNEQL